jgi:serine/threonine protein kinase
VRGLEDTCANQSIFVFKYLSEDLLGLIQKNLTIATTKTILKDVLRGLAAMHDKDIVHNGNDACHFQTARRWLINIRY